jgi:hypothetical protein
MGIRKRVKSSSSSTSRPEVLLVPRHQQQQRPRGLGCGHRVAQLGRVATAANGSNGFCPGSSDTGLGAV